MLLWRSVARSSLSITAAVLLLSMPALPARADLHFEEPIVNVGEVRTGTPLSHRFLFVNNGPDTVEVIESRTSCGCLTPRLEQRLYGPGEQGSLLLEVNTLNLAAGCKTWRVTLCYRSGETSYEVTLLMSARIVNEITVQPAALTVLADQAMGHDVYLTDRRSRPLAITEVRTSSPELEAQLAGDYQDDLGRQVRRIRLQVAADCPEGRHDEVVSIYTNDPHYRELKVPVTVIRRPRHRLMAMPSQVTLLAPPAQAASSRIVLIRDRENQSVVLDSVAADDPAVICQWAQGPGTMATVKINVDRSRAREQTLQTTVHVHVRQPLTEELTIPVVCTLQ